MPQIPLYFLPGTQCDELLWHAVFELLPEYFTPIPIVLPQKDSPSEIVHDLHRLFSNLQPDQQSLNLIGFSLGGYLAALYACIYPNHLKKLMIIANAPFSLPNAEIETRKQTLSYIKAYGYKGMPQKRITQLLGQTNKDNKDIINTIEMMDKRCGQTMLEQQLSNTSLRTNLVPELTSMSFDISILIGSEDCLVNITTLKHELTKSIKTQNKTQLIAREFNHASKQLIHNNISLNLVNGSGHMLPLESPQTVADHIIHLFS